jgi:hypothetical protein
VVQVYIQTQLKQVLFLINNKFIKFIYLLIYFNYFLQGNWSSLKKFISVRNRQKHLIEKYLHEFIYRRKHKDNLFEAFLNTLKN